MCNIPRQYKAKASAALRKAQARARAAQSQDKDMKSLLQKLQEAEEETGKVGF